MPLRSITRSVVAVIVGALSSGALVFSLHALDHSEIAWVRSVVAPLAAVYALPGVPLALGLAPFVPEQLVYWLAPAGGPAAFASLVGVGAFLFWGALFSWVASRRLRRGIAPASADESSNYRLERP